MCYGQRATVVVHLVEDIYETIYYRYTLREIAIATLSIQVINPEIKLAVVEG